MKIKALGFQNPFIDHYSNDIKLNSLDTINIILGKNNSGKTTILESIFRVLNRKLYNNHELSRYHIELEADAFKGKMDDFYQQVYGSNRDKSFSYQSVLDGSVKDNFQEVVSRLIHFLRKFDFLKGTKFELKFNLSKKKRWIFEIELINGNDIVARPKEEDFKKAFLSIIIDLNRNLNSVHSDAIKFCQIILESLLPVGHVIRIPSLRILQQGNIEYGPAEITKSTDYIEKILAGDIMGLSKEVTTRFGKNIFYIPNFLIILNRINQDRFKEIDSSFIYDFFQDINAIFPDINFNLGQPDEFKLIINVQEYGRLIEDWKLLGNGTQQLISLLFLLRLPGDYIYIIDEPENGLHPGLQSRLIHFIKNNILKDLKFSKQFFLATHSTSFIDFKGQCSHYRCKKDKDSFNIDLINKDSVNTLQQELGLTPTALLQYSGIIWVEGISDIPYIELLFHVFDIHDINAIIWPYFGNDRILSGNISKEMLREFNSNFAIIMDSDKDSLRSQMNGRLINRKSEFEDDGRIFWAYEEFCDIEGIIPQNFLNDYYGIDIEHPEFKKKGSFEKLEVYIINLRDKGVIASETQSYKKIRDSRKISELIINDDKYIDVIRKNSYLRKNIKVIHEEMKKWEGLSGIEDLIEDLHQLIEKYKEGSDLIKERMIKKLSVNKDESIFYIMNILQSGLVNDEIVYREILDRLDSNWLRIYNTRLIDLNKDHTKIYSQSDEFKKKLIDLFQSYSQHLTDKNMELIFVQKIGVIIDNNHDMIKNLGFEITPENNSIRDNDFWIHLTRKSTDGSVYQFLVRKLHNGISYKPDKVFLSMRYPQVKKSSFSLSDSLKILNEFIEYMERK